MSGVKLKLSLYDKDRKGNLSATPRPAYAKIDRTTGEICHVDSKREATTFRKDEVPDYGYYDESDNPKFEKKTYKTRSRRPGEKIFAGFYGRAERWMLENLMIDLADSKFELVDEGFLPGIGVVV